MFITANSGENGPLFATTSAWHYVAIRHQYITKIVLVVRMDVEYVGSHANIPYCLEAVSEKGLSEAYPLTIRMVRRDLGYHDDWVARHAPWLDAVARRMNLARAEIPRLGSPQPSEDWEHGALGRLGLRPGVRSDMLTLVRAVEHLREHGMAPDPENAYAALIMAQRMDVALGVQAADRLEDEGRWHQAARRLMA